MAKQATVKTNAVFGEISPRNFGRFDNDRPLWKNAFAILENFLICQNGGLMFWPGTHYVVAAKNPGDKIRVEKFQYSTSQKYILEIGDYYIRYCSVVNGVVGQVVSGGSPVVTVTPFAVADVFALQVANKQDVMYFAHPSYFPQKLIRVSATAFNMQDVPFVRGPFRDRNVGNVTITPSSATGPTTLTATIPAWGTGTQYVPSDWVTESAVTYRCVQAHAGGTFATDLAAGYWEIDSFFKSGHVKSQWMINSDATHGGVVYVTTYTDPLTVSGYVMAEGDGTAGNIGGTGAYTYWAEGAFSAARGFPTSLTFFEGRLLYGGAPNDPRKWYASKVGAYDNFDTGAWNNTVTDTSAYTYEIDSNISAEIRWMDVDVNLKLGTTGGSITATSPSATGTTPTNPPQIITDSDYAAMQRQPVRIGGYLYFLQSNAYQVRQLVYDLVTNRDKSEDMTMLADHILRDGGGGVEMKRQQSPNDRLLVPRLDGQLATFTRNVEQGVQGWCRRIAGSTAMGPGLFESVCVLPQDGLDDLIFVSVQRNINGTVVRYIEYFTPEIFQNDWDPVRLDASLTFDNPITITGITQDGVVTAPSHGLSDGDQVKIDNVVGMDELNYQHYLIVKLSNDTFSLTWLDGTDLDTTNFSKYFSVGQVRKMVTVLSGLDHLNGEVVSVQVDGGIPAATQTFLVTGGQITLTHPAAVVHVGLPYEGTIQFLPLGGAESQGRSRKVYIAMLRVWKSAGGSFGKDIDNQTDIIFPNQIPNVNPPPQSPLYTGDHEVQFESEFAKDWQPVFRQTKPLPFMFLASVFLESLEADK